VRLAWTTSATDLPALLRRRDVEHRGRIVRRVLGVDRNDHRHARPQQLGARKAASVASTGADLVVSGKNTEIIQDESQATIMQDWQKRWRREYCRVINAGDLSVQPSLASAAVACDTLLLDHREL